jgi:hypothetical protein
MKSFIIFLYCCCWKNMKFLLVISLVLVLLALPAIHATIQGGYITELEHSNICYTRYAPDIWNAYMQMLPISYVTNKFLLGRAISELHAKLSTYKTCDALGHALGATVVADGIYTRRTAADYVIQCKEMMLPGTRGREYQLATTPLMTCLRAVYRLAGAARVMSKEEEATHLANKWALSAMKLSSEEAIRFDNNYTIDSLANMGHAAAMHFFPTYDQSTTTKK